MRHFIQILTLTIPLLWAGATTTEAQPYRVRPMQSPSLGAFSHTSMPGPSWDSASGGSRSYRYLHGRDGLASRRPRTHRSVSEGYDRRGNYVTTEYYYDSAMPVHYWESAARSQPVYAYGYHPADYYFTESYPTQSSAPPVMIENVMAPVITTTAYATTANASGEAERSISSATGLGTRFRSSIGSGYAMPTP